MKIHNYDVKNGGKELLDVMLGDIIASAVDSRKTVVVLHNNTIGFVKEALINSGKCTEEVTTAILKYVDFEEASGLNEGNVKQLIEYFESEEYVTMLVDVEFEELPVIDTGKKLVKYLKLNDDPDVSDIGIIGFTVVIESVASVNTEADIETAKAAINGLNNSLVMPEHRVEELDCFENIAVREISDAAPDAKLGLVSYLVRTDREINTVFEIQCC